MSNSEKYTEGGRLFPYPQLTERDVKYLREYKYKGEDRGILNRLFMNKFYDFVVEKLLPSFVAPNTITLLGPSLVILEVLLIVLRYGDNSAQLEEGPAAGVWSNVFAAFAIFFFLTADNVDGKHARHIHLCSTLGDWLDHSLDVVSYFCITLTGIHYFSLGVTTVFVGVVTVLVTYEIVMWEAYLLDELVIHEVEACSEGMFAIASFHVIALFVDPSARPAFIPDRFYFKMPFFMTVFGALNILASFVALIRSIKRRFSGNTGVALTSAFIHIPVLLPIVSAYVFWHAYPEAVFRCHWSWTVYICACGMFWIYFINAARLLGWRITMMDVLRRPYHFVFTALPWVLVCFVSPESAITASGAVCGIAVLYMWVAITNSFRSSLGVSLWNVPSKKKEN